MDKTIYGNYRLRSGWLFFGCWRNGEKVGAVVQLAAAPLKFPGLRPWEIWLSEAQERMVLGVPPENWPRLQTICRRHDVQAVRLGTFEPTGRVRIFYGDRLGGLVRCAQGCHDAAIAYGTPFISGKDSLNNEYTGADGEKHAIPGTLLISALGVVLDIARTMTMDLKAAGNLLFVIGDTRPELGGSLAQEMVPSGLPDQGGAGVIPPRPVQDGLNRLRAVHRAIYDGLVQACHDCSEGGLAVVLAEMALAGRVGVQVDALPMVK